MSAALLVSHGGGFFRKVFPPSLRVTFPKPNRVAPIPPWGCRGCTLASTMDVGEVVGGFPT